MLVKKPNLELQEPVVPANDKYLSLPCGRSDLILSITGERAFSTDNILLALREERRDKKNMG